MGAYLLIDIVLKGASISFLKQVPKLTKLRQIRKSGSSKHEGCNGLPTILRAFPVFHSEFVVKLKP